MLAQIVKLRALLAEQTVATAADVEKLDERLLAEGLAAQREAHAELAGQTPLYAAVEAGAIECVRVLLGKNAAPSITKGGREACLRAAKARADEIGDALREMINDAPSRRRRAAAGKSRMPTPIPRRGWVTGDSNTAPSLPAAQATTTMNRTTRARPRCRCCRRACRRARARGNR